nr:hypothetical protein [Actinopolymorpha alba]
MRPDAGTYIPGRANVGRSAVEVLAGLFLPYDAIRVERHVKVPLGLGVLLEAQALVEPARSHIVPVDVEMQRFGGGSALLDQCGDEVGADSVALEGRVDLNSS